MAPKFAKLTKLLLVINFKNNLLNLLNYRKKNLLLY